MTNLPGLPLVTPQLAAQELLKRKAARNSLIAFTQYTFPQYKVDPVHELIARSLDEVVAGNILRLMIFAPPQHGKSELSSVRLPAYWLGRRPNDPVILSSYGADLAQTHSRNARQVVNSLEYKALFGNQATSQAAPIELRSDSQAVQHWSLAWPYRGSMLAVGVDGPVTGKGGLLGIIDDPFENWKEAQSQLARNNAWEWWRTTFRPRIWEGGAIILIMTRWHADDLAGRILNSQGDKWTVLRLPAMAETQEQRDNNNKFLRLPIGHPDPLGRQPGAPLAPSRFSSEALEEMQIDVGGQAWAAEYQGVPRAAEGNRFKRHWFDTVGAIPAKAKRIRYWDKAGTEGGGAFTAGVLMAKFEGFTFIEDVVRGQWSALEREQIIKTTAAKDARAYGGNHAVEIWIEQEPGSGGKESAEATVRNLSGYHIHKEPASGNKDARLEPFAAQAEAHNVKMLEADWNEDYIEELIAIPNGRYRDQSDATAGAFNKFLRPKAEARKMQHNLWDGGLAKRGRLRAG